MISTNLIRIDGGVYGGFDGCENAEFGCGVNGTTPLGLLLGFLALGVIYVVFNSIKDSISESNYQRIKRKKENDKRSEVEWIKKHDAELKSKGLLTNEDLANMLENSKKILEKSNSKPSRKKKTKKKTVKKKAAKKKITRKKYPL